MARLGSPIPFPPLDFSAGWQNSEHEREFKRMMEVSDNLDVSKSLVGLIVSYPIADGYAHYVVTKESPLTLSHIPYGDAWTVHPAMIRGLRREDLISDHRQRQALLLALGRK